MLLVEAASNSEAKLKSDDVIFVKAIALQRVNYKRRLIDAVEVCEAKVDLVTVFRLPWNESELLKAREWTEKMSYLTLSRIVW